MSEKLILEPAIKFTDEQSEAINADAGNILVSAAAGSGKTAVMTERIVRRLISGDISLDDILVLTFTDAASQNMSKKIEEKLYQYEESYTNLSQVDAALEISNQINLLPISHIETIHAFCLSLIKTFPEEVKNEKGEQVLAANFSTADENLSNELSEEALNKTLEDFYIRTEALAKLDGAEKEWAKDALGVIDVYAAGRNDENLRGLIKSIYSELRSFPDYKDSVEEELSDLLVLADNFSSSKHIELLFDGLELRLSSALLNVDNLKRRLNNPSLVFAGKTAKTNHDEYANMYSSIFNMLDDIKVLIDAARNSGEYAAAWDKIFELKSGVLFEKPRRASIKEGEEVPDLDGSEDADNYDKNKAKFIRNQLKNDFIDLLDDTLPDVLAYLDIKRPSTLDNLSKYEAKAVWTKTISEITDDIKLMYPLIKMVFELVLAYDENYSELKNKRNLIDFSDYEHFALQIIRTEVGREYCSAKFKEVYIDEYQDTSTIQETIISSISPNNTFMVGDVKQSIYRFRNARPEIFLSKAMLFQEHDLGKYFVLSKNFRSEAGILESINEVFSQTMTSEFSGIDYNNGHQMNVGRENTRSNGRVEILANVSEKSDKEYFDQEDIRQVNKNKLINSKINPYIAESYLDSNAKTKNIFHIAREILELQASGVNLKDIAILSRSNFDGDEIARVFNFLGISNNKKINSSIKDTHVLEIQLALLQSLDNSKLDIELATIMLSHLLVEPFNETDLLEIRVFEKENTDKKSNFYEACKFLASAELDDGAEFYELSKKVERFLYRYNQWRLRASEVAVSTLLTEIWNEVDYLEIVAKNESYIDVEELENFLNSIRSQEMSRRVPLNLIIQSLEAEVNENARVVNENDLDGDGVNILTLHKSKGLDFDYVFIYNLEKNLRDRTQDSKIILSENLGVGFHVADSDEYGLYTYPSHVSVAILEEEHRRFLTEEICLLYVAISRAKEKVYLCMNLDLDSKYSRLKILMDLAASENKEYLSDYIISTLSSYQDFILLAMSRSNDALTSEFCRYFDADLRDEINKNFENSRYIFNLYNNQEDLEETFTYLNSYMSLGDESDSGKMGEVDNTSPFNLLEFYYYPLNPELEFPAVPKRTVSEIKRKSMLDENLDQEEASFTSDINLELASLDELLNQSKSDKLTASQRGIALHSALRQLNVLKLREAADFSIEFNKQIELLENAEFLSHKEIELVRSYIDSFELYTYSNLASEIIASDNSYREMPFTFRYRDENEVSLVQGVIDLWFETQGEITLVDYKSDRLPNDKIQARAVLLDRYAIQMKIYTLALEDSMNQQIEKIVIWSLSQADEFIFNRSDLGLD